MWCPLATALLWLASGAGGLVPSARHPSASTRPRAPARLSRLFDAASVSVMPVDAARNGTAVKAKDAGPKFLFSPPMTLAKYDTMRKKTGARRNQLHGRRDVGVQALFAREAHLPAGIPRLYFEPRDQRREGDGRLRHLRRSAPRLHEAARPRGHVPLHARAQRRHRPREADAQAKPNRLRRQHAQHGHTRQRRRRRRRRLGGRARTPPASLARTRRAVLRARASVLRHFWQNAPPCLAATDS
mmetsp:Transcript_13036/g.45819  ORF Transcript_13036/g.45819 Transcript_13036/m.45819 type:complete len:243 (-) Transcript_13036:273-1001(-)